MQVDGHGANLRQQDIETLNRVVFELRKHKGFELTVFLEAPKPIESRRNREEVKGGFLSGCVQDFSFIFFASGLVSRCPTAYSSSVSPSRKSSDSGIALNTGQKPSGVTLKPNKADNWFQQRWPR